MSDPVGLFETERPRLRAIAYRMLGTPDDADDVVQDTWLRFSTADRATIDNPAAWLTTVASRLAIDRLRSAQRRRETYVGPWLADPIADEPAIGTSPDEAVLLAESLSLGFLAVLERVSPLERAVFILHDVFGYPFDEVAAIIERTPAATRQLGRRARLHIEDGRPRFTPDPEEVEELTRTLLAAAVDGDVETLKSYLADDVVHLSDGGPDHRAARAPVVGPHRVAQLFLGLAKRFQDGMEFHFVRANGQLGLYTTLGGQPFMLHVSNWVDGKLTGSFAVRNPDKLAAFHRSWSATRD
ncbi:MAG: RNA polymerase sigma factor SigJ [Acidimicrobiia bacterium]|nr:RNA polymerase sigma factor SigJ [Acidimicrobiia bacterium]